MSNNLSLPTMSAGQTNKQVTFNNTWAIFDAAITEIFTADLTSGNVTLTTLQYQQQCRIDVKNATVASRSVTLPALKRMCFVRMDASTTQAVNLVVGSTSLSLTINSVYVVFTDGTANGLKIVGMTAPGGGSTGQVLTKNSSADFDYGWVGAGTGSLAGLSDVSITSVVDQQRLIYDNGASKWKNKTEACEALPTASVNADFGTWVNQGGTAAVADVSPWGWTLTETTFQTTDALRCRVRSCLALTGDWDAIWRFQRGWQASGNMIAGALFRESGTGKIETMGWHHPGVACNRWTSATAFSATPKSEGNTFPLVLWIKLHWNSGANTYTWYFSTDGRVWANMLSAEAKTAFFTTAPDQVGVFINASAASASPGFDNMIMGVSSFSQA